MENAIFHAFSELLPRLIDDPAELRRRINRRRATKRPPRACCLAIRANDTRLGETSPDHREPGARHDIALTRDLVWRLCMPVQLPPRQLLTEAAERLGVTRTGLLPARVNGVFDTHHVEGFGAYWGKPRPLVSAGVALNPAVRGFIDPLGVYFLPTLLSRLPREMRDQHLIRIPRYYAREFPDTDQLHPEHPAVDPVPRKRKSLALPKPPPDYVWYKWKGDVYMGYDWRSPAHARHHEKRQRRLALARATAKRRRAEHPPVSRWSGSLKFRGWQWLCPCCDRRVQVLFLPIPPMEMQFPTEDPALARIAHKLKYNRFPAPAVEGFACVKCHHIRRYESKGGWNELVRWLSGGLLFGHEVSRAQARDPERPTGVEGRISNLKSQISQFPLPSSKLSYNPRINREPSKRRAQIEQLMLKGVPLKLIAATLRKPDGKPLSKTTVIWYAQQIYKQHNVSSLRGLLIKYGLPVTNQRSSLAEVAARGGKRRSSPRAKKARAPISLSRYGRERTPS